MQNWFQKLFEIKVVLVTAQMGSIMNYLLCGVNSFTFEIKVKETGIKLIGLDNI
jgi:hypothetical protein